MREKLLFILLVASVSICAQGRNNMVYCGIPKITAADLKLDKNSNNYDAVALSHGVPGPTTIIRISCGATVQSGNEPMYILDGIAHESAQIKSINPKDIVSIEVLKSPAALVMCGGRAINGVVIITTKKFCSRKFIIKDAKDGTGLGYATVTAISLKTKDSVSFVSNEIGIIETNVLKSKDFKIRVSCIGYKPKELFLSEIIKKSYEISLEKNIVSLKEVTVESSEYRRRIFCGGVFSKVYQVNNHTILSNNTTKVKIYPNPVSSFSTVNLSFTNAKEGLYQIRLLNAAGKLFYSVQKQISKNETEQIHLSSQMIPGIYVLQIIDAQKKLIQTSELIIQ